MRTPAPIVRLSASLSVVATVLALVLPSAASGAVLFRENFDNTAKADRSVRSVSWEVAYAGGFDQPASIATPQVANRYAVVNAGPGTGDGAPGYVWASIAAGNLRLLRGPVNKWPAPTVERLRGGAITFDAVASSGNSMVYLLIQLDNRDWYLSSTEFLPVAVGNMKSFSDAASPDAVRHRLPFTVARAKWQILTLTDGSPLGFDIAQSDLPESAVITGVGFLVRNTASAQAGVTVRLDTLSLESAQP